MWHSTTLVKALKTGPSKASHAILDPHSSIPTRARRCLEIIVADFDPLHNDESRSPNSECPSSSNDFRLNSPFPKMFRLKYVHLWAGGGVIMLAVTALLGWILGIDALKAILPGLISMKVNTAVCFILAGGSLLLQSWAEPVPLARLMLARAFAALVAVVGLLIIVEWLSGTNLGLDQFLIPESTTGGSDSSPGRMPLASAMSFVLLGTALLTLDIQARRTGRWIAQDLTVAVMVITGAAFLGYFYRVDVLNQFAPYSAIALNSVIAFWLLGLGILSARHKRDGILSVFATNTPEGILARRLLPVLLFFPLLEGSLQIVEDQPRLFGFPTGEVFLTVLRIGVLGGVVVWTIEALHRAERERRKAAEALWRSNARLDGIISSAMDAVISVDEQQRVVIFNPAAEEMFGVAATNAIGQHLGNFIPERFRSGYGCPITQFARTGTRTREMGELGAITGLRASGEEFPVEASVSQLQIGSEKLFTVILRDVSERLRAETSVLESQRRAHSRQVELEKLITALKQAERELSRSRENLRGLAARLQAVREEERTRVAREIHDVLAQELTRMKLDIAWVERRLAEPSRALNERAVLEKLSAMSATTDAAIWSVQRIATELRPVVLDTLGLCAAIEWQAKDFESRTDIPCTARVPSEDIHLNGECSTALFRILQESLTNVARHAGATRVEIELRPESDTLVLTTSDNGSGISPQRSKDPHSLGLIGMQERAAALGGECHITSGPGLGTVVEARIPFTANHQMVTP
ncbi:MAG: hypothetical protein C5B50_27860 [Verrucomicrobia bacterium]|nr:MAG: hypothetical protein C5B50_27860 [Verrucomicrobiota bacterium]